MPNDDNEISLRAHIRDLLLEYAYTHLTVDHVQFSETIVSEILPKILRPIPTHEPGLLVVPGDPFETLTARLKLDALPAYDEVWQPSPEVIQVVKETLIPPKGRPRTQTMWENDDEFDYESMAHRPMTPVLSRTSRKMTPSLGMSVKETSLAANLSSHAVLHVADENLPEEKPLKLDDYLDVKLTIDASVHSTLVDYQQRIPFLSCPTPRSFPIHAAEFLRSRSPEYEELFRPLSPPAFTRDQRVRGAKAEADNNILGQVKFAPVVVDEVDSDIANANMVVIDGWAAITSSASTPSLSSGASEVDELDEDADMWRPSSSVGVPSAIEALQAAKMDEPIFCRAERPRGGKSGKASEVAKQSLSTFMSAHLPPNSSICILTTPKSDDASAMRIPSPPPSASVVSLSMLGQPPSESDASSAPLSDSAGDTLDRDIRRMLKEHDGYNSMKSYQDVIMHECLDEKESMFMDVPKLPSPNEYMRNSSEKMQVNRTSTISLARVGQKPRSPSFSTPVTLKKASGLKSLNLELSWRPFAFGAKIPTHAELVGVDSLFPADKDFRDDQDETFTQEASENLLADLDFPIDFKDHPDSLHLNRPFQRNLNHDLRFLKDLHSDIDFNNLDARVDPNRDFDDDEIFLLPRSERRHLSSHRPNQNFYDTATNEILAFDDSQSRETSKFSSAITPDFDPRFPTTQNADDTDAYADTFAYASSNQFHRDDFNDGYGSYQNYEDLDAVRDRKKRRLSSTELDALCAMETMSQSLTLTVDPKDLMLPQTYNSPCTYKRDPAAPTTVAVYNSQSTSVPSQSQSLSLSLNEDNVQQELYPVNVVINTSRSANCDDGVRWGQSEPLGVLEDTIGVHRSISLGPQQNISTSNCQYRQQADGTSIIPRHQTDHSLNHQQPEPVPLFAAETVQHQDLRQPRAIESQIGCNGMQVNKQRKLHLPSSSALLCDDHTLSTFLQLRGRKDVLSTRPPSSEHEIHSLRNNALHETGNTTDIQDSSLSQVYQSAPPDLLSDMRAFSIPESWQPPTTEHTYLVSVDFVQQRALVCALESPRCAVRLVERDSVTPLPSIPPSAAGNPQLHSADISIIVGPYAGLVFFSLSALPSQTAYKTLLDALATHSWRFSNILLVLMAFPRSQLIRAANTDLYIRDGPNSYSPPVLKAARRVRRDLGLRDGTGEKRTSCVIDLAFADDVDQAAMLVRAFGDVALRGSVVDFTRYIGEEEQEGERDLAEVEGMNAFCAAVVLRCCTLGDFLEMSPEQRTEGLAGLIGERRIEHVNGVLSRRMQAMDMVLPSSSDLLSSPDV